MGRRFRLIVAEKSRARLLCLIADKWADEVKEIESYLFAFLT